MRTRFVASCTSDASDRNARAARRALEDARAGVRVYQALLFGLLDDCVGRLSEGEADLTERETTHFAARRGP